MSIKVTVNDEGLKQLQTRIKELGDQKQVPLVELMPDGFIQRYTNFQTLQEMIDASGVESAEEIRSEKFSEFVAAHSRFGSWQEMTNTAGIEYSKRKLGF